jgi:hypothetical protein
MEGKIRRTSLLDILAGRFGTERDVKTGQQGAFTVGGRTFRFAVSSTDITVKGPVDSRTNVQVHQRDFEAPRVPAVGRPARTEGVTAELTPWRGSLRLTAHIAGTRDSGFLTISHKPDTNSRRKTRHVKIAGVWKDVS